MAADENGRIAGLYTRASSTYGRSAGLPFAHAARRLVELAGIGPGERVLDLATGRGAVLFQAAKHVGDTGSVVGVDFSRGMVELTATEIRARFLERVASVQQLDVADLTQFEAD